MKKLLLAALLSATCLVAAHAPAMAKEFQLPEANPAVSVTLPDRWKPDTTDTGVEATSPDGGAYISAETATKKSIESLIGDDIKYLSDNGVTLDTSTQQQKDGEVNGMPVSFLRWMGKDKDGPTAITLVIFGVTDNLVLLLTSWASPEAETKYDADMGTVLNSIHRM